MVINNEQGWLDETRGEDREEEEEEQEETAPGVKVIGTLS